jgi:hypothetical protein
MRHLWSLLAGVLAAPLAWGLIAVGQARSQQTVTGWVASRAFDTTDLIEPASYLAVAGILLGLIATLRISPLGPLVGGVLLSAVYAGLFVKPLDLRNAVPDNWELFNRHIPLRGPLDNGTLLLVGLLLLVAMFSGQRWRRWPTPAAIATPDGSVAGADTETMPIAELFHPRPPSGPDNPGAPGPGLADPGTEATRPGTSGPGPGPGPGPEDARPGPAGSGSGTADARPGTSGPGTEDARPGPAVSDPGSGSGREASTGSGQGADESGTPEPAVARLGSTEGSASPPPLPERSPAAAALPPLPVRPVPARTGEPQPPDASATQPPGTGATQPSGAGAGEGAAEPPSGGKPAASEPARRPPSQSGPPPTESPWAAPPRATRSDQD